MFNYLMENYDTFKNHFAIKRWLINYPLFEMAATYAICEKKVVMESFDAVLEELKTLKYPIDLLTTYYIITATLDAHFEKPMREVAKLKEIHERIKLEVKATKKRKFSTVSEMGVYQTAFRELKTGKTFSFAGQEETRNKIYDFKKEYGQEILNTLIRCGFKKGKELNELVGFIIAHTLKTAMLDFQPYVHRVIDFKNHLENNKIDILNNTSSYRIIGRIFELDFNETDAEMIGKLSNLLKNSKIQTPEKQQNDYSAFRLVHDWKEVLQDNNSETNKL